MRQVVVVIPAFEPDGRLPDLVRRLRTDFPAIVVVDDGSRHAGTIFDELRTINGVIVLSHAENRGKGAALKTAFAEILKRFPDVTGAVTADADGQHLPADIVRVAESLRDSPGVLTLGVRDFGKDIPFRSLLGNLWTIQEFRLLTGTRVQDTQSGLRGIPRDLVGQLLSVPGDRYDFEIRMLVKAALSCGGIRQVPIRTIYEEKNGTSHFRPFKDTVSTQRALFAAVLTERFGGRSRASA